MSDGEIEERHTITDFDDGLGANATHGSAKATIKFEDSEFAQETNRFGVGELIVVDNLRSSRWRNTLPVTVINQLALKVTSLELHCLQCVSLSLVIQVSAEKGEEVVHLSLE